MTIRIAIAYNFNDIDWLGGRNYFGSLFSAIAATGQLSRLEVVLVMGNRTTSSLPEEFPWVQVVRTPLMDRMHPLWLLRQLTLRNFDRDPLLERLLRRHRIDVLSHSGYLVRGSPVKTLPWLYDFQFLHLPKYWRKAQIRWAEQRYNAACAHGDGVIVSSHDALRDLASFAPACAAPAHVLQFVSNPVDVEHLPSKQDVLKRYSLPEAYFYLPNQFWANKNHRLVIDALAHLREAGLQATIACTGKTFDGRKEGYFDELMAYCSKAGVQDLFRVLGVVPYKDLQALMAHARAVINPSRFEGWSTTVEEAKTLHRRLLLSDIPVHREQAPDLGRYFGVDDSLGLAARLRECLAEEPLPLEPHLISSDYSRRLLEFGQRYLGIVGSVLSPQARAPRESPVSNPTINS